MLVDKRRLFTLAQLAAPWAMKKVYEHRTPHVGFVHKYEVCGWAKGTKGYEYRHVWGGSSSVKFAWELKKARKAYPRVRVTVVK